MSVIQKACLRSYKVVSASWEPKLVEVYNQCLVVSGPFHIGLGRRVAWRARIRRSLRGSATLSRANVERQTSPWAGIPMLSLAVSGISLRSDIRSIATCKVLSGEPRFGAWANFTGCRPYVVRAALSYQPQVAICSLVASAGGAGNVMRHVSFLEFFLQRYHSISKDAALHIPLHKIFYRTVPSVIIFPLLHQALAPQTVRVPCYRVFSGRRWDDYEQDCDYQHLWNLGGAGSLKIFHVTCTNDLEA